MNDKEDPDVLLYRCVQCNAPVRPPMTELGRSEYALEQCSTCKAFVDHYVEHDRLLVLIDLLLAKPSVYRHLLYNEQASLSPNARRRNLVKLGLIIVLADLYLTWSRSVLRTPAEHLIPSIQGIVGKQLGMLFAYILGVWLLLHGTLRPRGRLSESHHLIILSTLLASVTKLFFMSLSLVWREALPLSKLDVLKIPTEDAILIMTELVSRAVALSVATDSSPIVSGAISLLAYLPIALGVRPTETWAQQTT